MKKVCLLMFAAVLMMTGCTKIKTNKLQGFWAEPVEYSEAGYTHYGDYYPSVHLYRSVFEFINSNTCYFYHNVCDNPTTLEVWWDVYADNPMPEHSGWYYENKYTYTYVFEDNKIILSNGTIYTYMDGKLYKDGSSTVLSPW